MATANDGGESVELLARQATRHRRSREADQRLLRRHARAPSGRTRDALVHRWLPLARAVAREHAGPREPLDDLLQVASLALMRAIDRYDPERGASFASFAVPTIRGEILRHFRDRCWTVRPTRTLLDLAPRVEATRVVLTARLGRAPDVADIAGALDLEPDAVGQTLRLPRLAAVESLDALEDGDGERPRLALAVEDAGYARAEHRAMLEPLLRTLDARERRIVRLRFVEDRTQQEIADAEGISQMHVSRLLARAVERMSSFAEAA
jgi:RNA polymerase sigma-B factor